MLEPPSTGQVHDSLGVVFLLQIPENGEILTIKLSQGSIVDREVGVQRGLLIRNTLLLDDKAPHTSSSLGDGSEVLRIVPGILPLEDYAQRIGGNGGVTSPIRRESRWELGV